MDFDAGAAPDIAPVAPVETPEVPQAPAEVEAPAKAPEAPRDTFGSGTPDAQRLAGARDPKDGFDLSNQNPWTKLNGGDNPSVQPVLYQGPGIGVPVPREQTHLGITEDEGRAAGLPKNFVNYAADKNADVDAKRYHDDPSHAYNFSQEGTLRRAEDLGRRMEEQTARFQAAKNDRERKEASIGMASVYGEYLHMLQDNRAHGGTNREEHYGDKVDDNPENARTARLDTRDSMRDLKNYFSSREVDLNKLNPGPRPGYSWPPLKEAYDDKHKAPPWDGQSRMWNRDEMSREIQNRFNNQLRMGPKGVAL